MKHKFFLAIISAELILLLGLSLTGVFCGKDLHQHRLENRRLVETLMLTDLAFWTEARYTRHPSQVDFFTPFQDFPGAIEHFPAGSILAPPPMSTLQRVQTDTPRIAPGE
ncbi:hypothetical protein DSLASN_43910 [Desulfoluna limicola]|uniref:Uncharacterized protein n=1 Tax=Desulfoluna limicola TaxID=2810562 RepID=A0ABN6F8U1_9BACT|nr:hypothetical protein [Desulfoluna limicola]BCS98759.1 hypothetical protein DSLASN_43910 [Desulfoluna limicola]